MADNARLNSTSSPAGGSAVGRDLREARESLGITIPQLADTLRIRAAHIAALEEGRFADLPGRPYTFGFARSIARHLGLDPDAVAARLRDEVMGTSAPVELVFPESTEDKRLSRTGWVVISLVAVVVAYGAWIMVSSRSDNRPAEFSSDTPSSQVPEVIVASPDAEPSAPAPDESTASSQAGSQEPAATPEAQTPAPRAEVTPQQRPPAAQPAPPSATPAPSVPRAAAPPVANAPAPQAEGEEEVDATPEPSDVASAAIPSSRVVIRARQDSWVQVQASNGSTVFARTMRAGETYAVPDQRGLRLTTGNAGGIDLVVDGQTTPSLGQVGAVRRNLSLDANRLKAGTLE